ncbi:MAG: hypothetical protein K2M46_08515 [Lachnospiraceae bacterium]|nr:hypothetical protein [Lachnospiraceae bacterium]
MKNENISHFKVNKVLAVLAFLHWLLSFVTDRLFFTYTLFDFSDRKQSLLSVYGWGIKFVFLVVLFLLWQLAGWIYRRYKENSETVKKRLWYTGIYFGLMVLLLFCVWPGAWRMDEFGILRDAKTLLPTFWQGYLTSLFYSFSLMLLPTPAGVVVLQCLVNACCVGYVCEKAEKLLKVKHRIWLFLPFLTFPVLDSNMYPMRMSVYVFLELFLAAVFLSAVWENRTLTKTETVLAVIVTALVAVWRTEGIYYLVWIPIVYLVIFWKQESRKRKLFFAIAVAVATLGVMVPQTVGNKLVSGDQYEITSMVLPLAPLLCEAEGKELELMEDIDKVIDTDLMIAGYQEGKSGISVFWSEPALIRQGYSAKEYGAFKSAYYRLILCYPKVFLQERLYTFTHSYGILNDTRDLFDSMDVVNFIEFRENYSGVKGISSELRRGVFSVLELWNSSHGTEKNPLFTYVYSFLPALAVLLLAALICFSKRNYKVLVVLLGVLGKVPLIFITAPSLLFMYYYGIYLIGTVGFVYGVIYYAKSKKNPEKISDSGN